MFSATSSHSIPAFYLRLHLHERIALSKCRRRLSIFGLPPMALLWLSSYCVSPDADMRVAILTPQLLAPMIVFASIDQG
ncbi:hypothetical protein V8C44DRAFT_326768 [Trichoderma aethiopicum]